jgi:hypothetical protein
MKLQHHGEGVAFERGQHQRPGHLACGQPFPRSARSWRQALFKLRPGP